jgi:hypothetical protein
MHSQNKIYQLSCLRRARREKTIRLCWSYLLTLCVHSCIFVGNLTFTMKHLENIRVLLTDHEQIIDIEDKTLCAAGNSGSNDWFGIMSTDKTKTENVYYQIMGNIKHILVNGELKVMTFLPDKCILVWNKPGN